MANSPLSLAQDYIQQVVKHNTQIHLDDLYRVAGKLSRTEVMEFCNQINTIIAERVSRWRLPVSTAFLQVYGGNVPPTDRNRNRMITEGFGIRVTQATLQAEVLVSVQQLLPPEQFNFITQYCLICNGHNYYGVNLNGQVVDDTPARDKGIVFNVGIPGVRERILEFFLARAMTTGNILNQQASEIAIVHNRCGSRCAGCRAPIDQMFNLQFMLAMAQARMCPVCLRGNPVYVEPPKPSRSELRRLRTAILRAQA